MICCWPCERLHGLWALPYLQVGPPPAALFECGWERVGGETLHVEPDGCPIRCSTHSFPITHLHTCSGAGKRAPLCLRPVSVYVCVLLFTGMQTQGPLFSRFQFLRCCLQDGYSFRQAVAGNSLLQWTKSCRSGGGRSRCSQRQLHACVDEAKGETLSLRLLFSPCCCCRCYCCCCCWIFERAHIHTNPRVGCTGQGPPGRDLSDGWRSGAVCCAMSHLPWADWLQLQDLRGFFFSLYWRWMDISSMFSLWWSIVSWQCCFSVFI